MLPAQALLKDGQLDEGIEALKQSVRSDPANAELRAALFELFALAGDWDRSLTQLNVCGDLDAKNAGMLHAYRPVLQCEAYRQAVFAGERSPLLFGEPLPWMAKLMEALTLYGSDPALATEHRARALEDAEAVSGEVNGEPFEWICDMDDRLGPMFELIVNGRYYWVPMARVSSLELEQPSDLRDLVWLPGVVRFANEGTLVCFMPTRYPGSESTEDAPIRMARKTVWDEPFDGVYFGLGQRMFATDQVEIPMLEARSVALDTTA